MGKNQAKKRGTNEPLSQLNSKSDHKSRIRNVCWWKSNTHIQRTNKKMKIAHARNKIKSMNDNLGDILL